MEGDAIRSRLRSGADVPVSDRTVWSDSRVKKRTVLVALAALVLVALGWGGWWWTHPTLLSDESMGLGSGSAAPKPLDEAVYHVGVAGAPWVAGKHRETITFHGYQPRFSTDGAGLKVALSVCVARMGKTGLDVVGFVDGDLGAHCAEVRPVKDGSTMETGTREYLVATVTATRAGKSTLTAISVDYSRSGRHLWQHGEDRIEGSATITAHD